MNNNPYLRWVTAVPMRGYHYPNMNMYNGPVGYNGQSGQYWIQNTPSPYYLSNPSPTYSVVDYLYPNMNMYNSPANYNGQREPYYWVQNTPTRYYTNNALPTYPVIDEHSPYINMYDSRMNYNNQRNSFYRTQNIQAQFLPNIPTPNIPTIPTPNIPNIPTPNIPTPNIPNIPTPNIPIQIDSPTIPTPNIPIQIDSPSIPTPNIPRSIPTIPTPTIPDRIPTVPTPTIPDRIPTIPTPTIPTPRIDWREWREKVEQWGGHWVEEGESTWNEIEEGSRNITTRLNTVRRRFQACVPPVGYSCVEYKVIDNLPIFGSVETEDIIVRICHPTKIRIDVEGIITSWLKDCLEVAVNDAAKAFFGVLVMTAWGAFVGSLSAAISAAINTFRDSIFTCLTTPPENIRINDQEIIPSVYMRKHSRFIPRGNNCFPMYDNWGHEID
ncbi:hypothetical protein [Lysinibacillus antri]|uniref:Uncharacterized protein n=1 Tax=Lysinibacillus antri TaxID=2498145 RepID=A0A3S0RKI1_9BACI|nr:hypothetical protein [Lysinibacillus antri]RUL54794.1 hypothetical protein EK386_06400 [Lysinibacillus antri]